jgi:hypothetical protein
VCDHLRGGGMQCNLPVLSPRSGISSSSKHMLWHFFVIEASIGWITN